MTNLPNIGKPAATALNSIDVTELKEVAQLDEENLLKLHGVGPKAVSILKDALDDAKLKFKAPEPLPVSTDFLVYGSLGCNNAPKREVIRDYIIKNYKDSQSDISALKIISIVTHGKEGAANGFLVTNNGQKYHWAHFFEFDSHKKDADIKNVTSYSK
ncbi:MAG: DNA-binding protein [Clostridiaceae bacterium]|nr:DNA-binding protein [Clostridiaceae bacterium]